MKVTDTTSSCIKIGRWREQATTRNNNCSVKDGDCGVWNTFGSTRYYVLQWLPWPSGRGQWQCVIDPQYRGCQYSGYWGHSFIVFVDLRSIILLLKLLLSHWERGGNSLIAVNDAYLACAASAKELWFRTNWSKILNANYFIEGVFLSLMSKEALECTRQHIC